MNATFKTEGTRTYPNLIAGEFPRVERKITIASGAGALSAGSVLALNASDKAVLVDSDAGEGGDPRREPKYILADAADATSADIEAIAYETGQFNEAVLTFGGDDDADDHRAALRALSIFLHNNLGA